MFITDSNFLSKDSINFIEGTVLSSGFPYYYSPNTIHNPPDNNAYMSHDVLRRPEERTSGEMFNSTYGEQFLRILKEFTDKNSIDVKEALRISVNITFAGRTETCPTHVDHPYPHKQLLIYLNDCDSEATTVVLSEDRSRVLNKATPEKYKGVCFGSAPHYMVFPKQGARIVAVFTFR